LLCHIYIAIHRPNRSNLPRDYNAFEEDYQIEIVYLVW
jgi:hypothetical protein